MSPVWITSLRLVLVACALAGGATRVTAQAAPAAPAADKADKADKAARKAAKLQAGGQRDSQPGEPKVPRLFQSESPVAVTFTTNIGQIRGDKDEKAPWHWASLSYVDSGRTILVPARARTRGIWRLKHCAFPPIRLHFSEKETKHTLFHGLGKPKLVNYCRDNGTYEQYVLQELQLYRLYALLTPVSHRVRLLKVTYADSATGKQDVVRWAFITEDPDELARRLHGTLVKIKGAGPDDLDHFQLALAYLFQFLIGNTDFSFSGLHNAELIGTTDGRILPVAYDFDYAGAINASYATPDPSFRISSVRERRLRAYCTIAEEFPNALAVLLAKKDAIYALYHDEVGKLMDPRAVRETLAYFDSFYDQVRSPREAEQNVFSNCQGPH